MSSQASQTPLHIGMIGCGTVGGGVAELLQEQADLYERRLGRPLRLGKVLVRDADKHRTAAAQDPALVPDLFTSDADDFFATPNMPIVVEAAGGLGVISNYVRRALRSGRHVVTANKALLAEEGQQLFALAHRHDVSIAFEAACGGGMPIITALQFGLMANQIHALYGILNGTCNYILTEMTQKKTPYADALADAQAAGFAEADPTMDVSGRDAAQKLTILASLAFGRYVDEAQVACEGIADLDLTDIHYGAELGYDIKLLAIAERHGDELSLRVHPCFVGAREPLAQVHGSFNALSVYGHATGHTMYLGRGAGKLPTASAVVSDVMNVASGWYPKAFASMNLWSDRQDPARTLDDHDLQSRFYLRINALDVPGVMAKVSQILGENGISLSAILQHESAAGQYVPVVITTHEASQGAISKALTDIEALDVIRDRPIRLHLLDMPAG